ncbi:response regulator [Larkinella punicea]|uniref:DNA-binding response regulator n=1 Tax=Larkinella punicea TaxID=2315727 RepID=A0A368JRV0_9BACT|nr:response regulator [Larkinella punicea]RCR68901.1 DNA-binding response regulator [Larkinella punicea]
MAVRIVIYERDCGFRKALSSQIAVTAGYVLLGAFSDTIELENQLRGLNPQVILLDIELSMELGKTANGQLHREFPEVDVLLLTSDDLDERVMEGICAGASGYLLKKIPPDRILRAICEIYDRSQ